MGDSLLVTVIDGRRQSTLAIPPGSNAMQAIHRIGSQGGEPLATVAVSGFARSIRAGAHADLLDDAGARTEEIRIDTDAPRVHRLRDRQDGSTLSVYVRPVDSGMRTYRKMAVLAPRAVSIGSAEDCDIVYDNPLVQDVRCSLAAHGDSFFLDILGQSAVVCVNAEVVTPDSHIQVRVGDVISLADLRIGIGSRVISINKPTGLSITQDKSVLARLDHQLLAGADRERSQSGTGKAKAFHPTPRLMRSIHERTYDLDAPPAAASEDEAPAIMQLGPSFLMGAASLFMLFSTVSRLRGGVDMLTVLPTMAMTVSMLGGMVLWPILNGWYNKRRRRRNERRRIARYTDYLSRIESELQEQAREQGDILRGNRMAVGDVLAMARQGSSSLMNRNATHSDFMDIRLGIGREELRANVSYPRNGFTMESDMLLEHVKDMEQNPPVIDEVPIAVNLVDSRGVGIVGDARTRWNALRGFLVQLTGLYDVGAVRVVLIADDRDASQWEFMRRMPHAYADDGALRFIASGPEDMIRLDSFLQHLYDERVAHSGAKSVGDYGAYYVVVCANRELASSSSALDRWARLDANLGLSMVHLAPSIHGLPSECGTVIEVRDPQTGDETSRVFDRIDVPGTTRPFVLDIAVDAGEANDYAAAISSLEVARGSGARTQLPESLGYMQMHRAGKAEDLDVLRRWKGHDASRTLGTVIGVLDNGADCVLNLHEDSHGPHGLIAGMTGSGKSELIITYVLSMALDYAPDHVSFVLIDYKGGGLAGAFANERVTLPHLAGTITNLDGASITRSLVSIHSELERRQRLFNQARDITGEATMDIYTYLSYYRQGILRDPVPHLFIVADEFAELKQQEPEFMEELISAARIGRSLGVHLILATQKPSGVVNDQIWSNSRFKISLKVADGADSHEMLRRKDAAELRHPGRFYMLVGYNEAFLCAQSAYTGTRYVPTDCYEPKRDDAVSLIGNTGEALATLRPAIAHDTVRRSELDAVLEQICQASRDSGLVARQLWMDPLPDALSVSQLRQRMGYKAIEGRCIAAMGVVDDPKRQSQRMLSIDFDQTDNVMLLGTTASGVEDLAATVVDSLIRDATPEDVNVYAFDMGSGLLAAFDQAPQVGGVVGVDETERVLGLFSFLEGMASSRRARLNALGMRYGDYLSKRHGRGDAAMARIIVVLCNIASFYERYPKLEDRLTTLTHEGPRYGIHWVVSASSAMQPRLRLRSNFSVCMVTAFNDDNDYASVFGSMSGVSVPRHLLRGLVQENKEIYEFQAAHVEDGDALRRWCRSLRSSWDGEVAKPIPTLPARVLPRHFDGVLAAQSLPVGYDKDTALPCVIDMRRTSALLVSAHDAETIETYVRALALCMAHGPGRMLIVDHRGVLEGCHVDGGTMDVATQPEDIDAALHGMVEGERLYDAVVVLSATSLMSMVDEGTAATLRSWLEHEGFRGGSAVVLCDEAWRFGSVYDPWLKVFTANAQGLWIGPGFMEQNLFRYRLVRDEFRNKATSSDGVVTCRGENIMVRVVQPPQVDDDGSDGSSGDEGIAVKSVDEGTVV